MSIKFTVEVFDLYIQSLTKKYRIFAPATLQNKGKFAITDVVGYKEVFTGNEINFKEKSFYSPKEIIFPIRETLFHFVNGKTIVPDIDVKPIVVFLRPCDINGIERLDTMFLENGDIEDFYYKRRRDLIKYIMIECTEGFDSCFCVSMDSNKTDKYDAVIRVKENELLLNTNESDFILQEFGEKLEDFKVEFIEENKTKVCIPPIDKVTPVIFENTLWKEYTRRCIACGRCNTSCITCSCFTMQDTFTDNNKVMAERRRRWASCHVDKYSDMAGGHSFREKNGERMRFKTMHKINDYYRRFGSHMCVGCGRCDDVCPEYISFSKCINKISEIIEGGKNE